MSLLLLLASVALLGAQPGPQLGNHPAVYDPSGALLPWTSWPDALEREVNWYLRCPVENGYPRFITMTFMDGSYQPITSTPNRRSFIPAMQNGMGIISYLKYFTWTGGRDQRLLGIARAMGDYLVKESLTPDSGKYPRFTRSTGWRDQIPQRPGSGSQADQPFEIEPDKGGIAGHALALLYARTKDRRYLDQALHNARVLAANMREGDALHSPWPFRVDYRTGEARGEVSGNMSFILRLFDQLIAGGYSEFHVPRNKLWSWIRQFQIPNLAKDGLLWVQFFEDHAEPDNRTAWAPLNLARYLIERKDALDPDWKADAQSLIEFVNRRFITVRNGVAVCGEQDYDKNPWGGILSTYGAVLAMYSSATGSFEYKLAARQALNYSLYQTDADGCPSDGAYRVARGGWQEDAHTDRLHNFMDAIAAFPGWGRAEPRRIAVIAHRGEHLHHPENTIAAFQAAYETGADFFEADVRTTADGQLVLMHDAAVDRTTNGKGQVAHMTFDEIRKLDAGGSRVPTFDEALAFARGRIGVYVDGKAVSAADSVAAIERHGMRDHVVIYGGAGYLKQIAALRPNLRVMPEADNPAALQSLLKTLPLKVVAFDARDFNPETTAVAIQAKIEIFVDRLGPADNPAFWQDAIDRGATGIQTDHPAELVAYLKSKGYR